MYKTKDNMYDQEFLGSGDILPEESVGIFPSPIWHHYDLTDLGDFDIPDLPMLELEKNNLIKMLGQKILFGLHDSYMEDQAYELPTPEDVWEDLEFTLGINPTPGYEVDISKKQYGSSGPFAADWKVKLTTPMPEFIGKYFE